MNIAFVPARCGSKSIAFKNIKLFLGKPLIYWSLKALNDADKIDEIIVATDCDKIEKVVESFNFHKVSVYRRDQQNASDEASTESVMLEFLFKRNYNDDDRFVLVQVTNPFTTPDDFDKAINKMIINQYDSLLSCCRFKRFFWNEDGLPKNYDFTKRPRRQEFKGELLENGAFYINSIHNILSSKCRLGGKVGIYEMPEYSYVELDEQYDWDMAEQIMAKYVKREFSKKDIKIVLSDVDGVLTDGGMFYSEKGDEIKKFNTYDGMAFAILKERGIKCGIITGEDRQLNRNRAKKLNLDFAYHGIKNKLKILDDICEKENVLYENVAFVGDDINDLEVLSRVGLAACPASANDRIKNIPKIKILNKNGGEGVLRELIDTYII